MPTLRMQSRDRIFGLTESSDQAFSTFIGAWGCSRYTSRTSIRRSGRGWMRIELYLRPSSARRKKLDHKRLRHEAHRVPSLGSFHREVLRGGCPM